MMEEGKQKKKKSRNKSRFYELDEMDDYAELEELDDVRFLSGRKMKPSKSIKKKGKNWKPR